MKRKTVGAHSLELSQKKPESTDPIELERAMQEDYLDNLLETIDKAVVNWKHDFFVVVLTKNEKLMPNVFRNYFSARQSCPTPEYDQTVFKYMHEAGTLEYIWTVPSKDSVAHLLTNSHLVVEAEKELLIMCRKFVDGSLYLLAKKLNGEQHDSPLLIH